MTAWLIMIHYDWSWIITIIIKITTTRTRTITITIIISTTRLIVRNTWNYAAYRPYYQCAGPKYFNYAPNTSMNLWANMRSMAMEARFMAVKNPIHAISKNEWRRITKTYAFAYDQGRWLSKSEKKYLSLIRVTILWEDYETDNMNLSLTPRATTRPSHTAEIWMV